MDQSENRFYREKAPDCDHIWLTNSGRGGEPEFRSNSQMGPEPTMHVICTECRARTWFTEKQWFGGKEFWSLR